MALLVGLGLGLVPLLAIPARAQLADPPRPQQPFGARYAVRVHAGEDDVVARSEALSRRAPAVIAGAAGRLGLAPPPLIEVFVYGSPPASEEAARRLGLPRMPRWVAGFAEPAKARIVLFADQSTSYPHDDLEGVLAHEAAHVILAHHLPKGARLARWYEEGVALAVERGHSIGDAMQLARLTLIGKPIPLSAIARDWPREGARARQAYAQSMSMVDFSWQAAGPDATRRLVAAMRSGLSFERAFAAVHGVELRAFEQAWYDHVRSRVTRWPLVALGLTVNALMVSLALVAWVRVRARRRRQFAEMEEQERFEGLDDERFRAPGEEPEAWRFDEEGTPRA